MSKQSIVQNLSLKKKQIFSYNKLSVVFLIFLITFLYMLSFCFLSPIFKNKIIEWDSSVYLTMGRSILEGKVIYRDIFDHKGPYLYFLIAIVSLFSTKSLLPYFMLTVIMYTISNYYIYRISKLFLKDDFKCILVVIFYIICFLYGGKTANIAGPEGFTLPFALWSVYIFIKYLIDNEKMFDKKSSVINGVFCSIAFCMKPNGIFVWLVIYLFLTICLACYRKYNNLLLNYLYFFAGAIIGLMPIIIYCYINNLFYEWINSSIVINFKYTQFGENIMSFNVLHTILRAFGFILKAGGGYIAAFYSSILFLTVILCFIDIVVFFDNKKVNNNFKKIIIPIFVIIYSFIGIVCENPNGWCASQYFILLFPVVIYIFIKTILYVDFINKTNKNIVIMLFLIFPILVGVYFSNNTHDNDRNYALSISLKNSNLTNDKIDSIYMTNKSPRIFSILHVSPKYKYFYSSPAAFFTDENIKSEYYNEHFDSLTGKNYKIIVDPPVDVEKIKNNLDNNYIMQNPDDFAGFSVYVLKE